MLGLWPCLAFFSIPLLFPLLFCCSSSLLYVILLWRQGSRSGPSTCWLHTLPLSSSPSLKFSSWSFTGLVAFLPLYPLPCFMRQGLMYSRLALNLRPSLQWIWTFDPLVFYLLRGAGVAGILSSCPVYVVLGIKPRALCLQSRHSAPELCCKPQITLLNAIFFCHYILFIYLYRHFLHFFFETVYFLF